MDIFNILAVLGGLALFLYGMNVMGDGLVKISGGRLKSILSRLTSNIIKAVLLGAGITAVIQSSSATTVMVVGFVNSGIMKLSQAVGVIMGANIGTTVTSWLLSLTGIESNNVFINFLKPTSFSPILALIGVIFLMFSKKERKKDVGTTMIGFAILMLGMEIMGDSLKPLADVPGFTQILTMFSNPILGMLAGAILTAIVQSSSASIGILQAMCMTGSVTYGSALPIIMGQNIGTCITALLSSIGANKNAKRAALVHLYFNMIGTFIFMTVFYSINVFVNFSFLGNAANTGGIALIHSMFNILATFVLLPFAKGLEKLACLTIRDDEDESSIKIEDDFQLLDARFLNNPSLAVEQSRKVTIKMADLSRKALFESIDLLDNYDKSSAKEIVDMEDNVDRYEDKLGTYLVKLNSKDLSEKDSRTLSILLHCIGEFERIADHSVNLVEASREMYEKNLTFSKQASGELKIFSNAVKDIVNTAITVFEDDDIELAKTIEPLEEVIDYLNVELKNRHIKRLRRDECTIELGFIFSDIITNYERIADHCSNIAVYLININEDEFYTHEYLYKVKQEDNEEFKELYKKYKQKYLLPKK